MARTLQRYSRKDMSSRRMIPAGQTGGLCSPRSQARRHRSMADELTSALGLGEPYHIGIAVSDLADAIEQFQSILGVGPWGRIDAEVPSIYRGAETVSGVRSAFARLGSMLVEIVEPTTGD